ncbi:MAG: VIT1/CCC1 transporter family protein [Rhodanobacter sp.]
MHGTKFRRRKTLGWLPAAVLGADDGLVSTASLVLGVAAAHATHASILVAGTAGLVAGAMSMAASEYVSVHALSDSQAADMMRRHAHLKANTKCAHEALVTSYLSLGLNPVLAKEVADGLMANGAVGALARDELLVPAGRRAHPNQAALASAASFAIGASIPIVVTLLLRSAELLVVVPAIALVFLALLGGSAAHFGGARVMVGALRVSFWGALAMALTAGVGTLFGAAV